MEKKSFVVTRIYGNNVWLCKKVPNQLWVSLHTRSMAAPPNTYLWPSLAPPKGQLQCTACGFWAIICPTTHALGLQISKETVKSGSRSRRGGRSGLIGHLWIMIKFCNEALENHHFHFLKPPVWGCSLCHRFYFHEVDYSGLIQKPIAKNLNFWLLLSLPLVCRSIDEHSSLIKFGGTRCCEVVLFNSPFFFFLFI